MNITHFVATAALAGSAIVSTAPVASAAIFTSRPTFVTQLQPGFFENAFTGVPTGPSPAAGLNFSSGGFSYNVNATTSTLFNDPGVISTNLEGDSIRVTFTGGSPTAVGGNFWSTNINVVAVPATIVVTLSDGQVSTFTSTSSSDFRGFTSAVPIVSLLVSDINNVGAPFTWPTMDNLIVGRVIPEPATLGLAALGGLALLRRRRA